MLQNEIFSKTLQGKFFLKLDPYLAEKKNFQSHGNNDTELIIEN